MMYGPYPRQGAARKCLSQPLRQLHVLKISCQICSGFAIAALLKSSESLGKAAPDSQVSQLFLRPEVMLLALSCTLRAELRRDLALCVSSLGPNLQAGGLAC